MPSRADDDAHRGRTHERWAQSITHHDWRYAQCGRCAWWVPLTGVWGEDWGACTNPASPNDRSAMFEHDACPAFEVAGDWVVPQD